MNEWRQYESWELAEGLPKGQESQGGPPMLHLQTSMGRCPAGRGVGSPRCVPVSRQKADKGSESYSPGVTRIVPAGRVCMYPKCVLLGWGTCAGESKNAPLGAHLNPPGGRSPREEAAGAEAQSPVPGMLSREQGTEWGERGARDPGGAPGQDLGLPGLGALLLTHPGGSDGG